MPRRIAPSSLLALCAALIVASAAYVLQFRRGASSGESDERPATSAASAFFGTQRTYPANTFSQRALRDAYHAWITNTAPEPASPDSAWRSIGPTNVGGRVLALAINPEAPWKIWVGTATGGLWRLTDSGSAYHWQPIETGFPTQSVGAIYIDSADRNLLFIGTGEVYSYYRTGSPGTAMRTLRGFYGTGIYRSTNDGTSWEQVLAFPDSNVTAVNKIIANPRYTRSMYAATTEGVYKSYDQGVTWQMKLPVKMAMDLAINRIDTTRIFAACGDQDAPNPGIYRSTDGGEHWTQLNVVPTVFTGRSAVAISPTNPKIVYAGISDRFGAQGLYRSTDQGDTWEIQSTADYTSFQGWYTNVIEVNPLFNGEVLCGGIALWKSMSGGGALTRIEPQGSYHVDIHAITYQRSDPQLRTFYLGTDGGVYKSTDDGLTFRNLNDGFVSGQFYNGFANAWTDTMLALGGLQDNGTYKYTGNANWQFVLGGDGSWCAIAPTDPKIMLAQYVYVSLVDPFHTGVQIQRSADGFASYKQVLMDTLNAASFTTPIVAARTGRAMYAGNAFVYKSTDDGQSWGTVGGMIDPFVAGANACIALAVSRNSPDTIYAATAPVTHDAGVFASFNGGTSWSKISTAALPNRYPTHVAVDGRDARTAYVTYSGFGSGHVFRTTNAGASWTDITHNLPDLPTNVILPDPLDRGILYVGNDLGVYVSTDTGAHWQQFSKGMAASIVTAITMTETNRTLRVATHGRGVYERAALAARVGVAESQVPGTAVIEIYPTVVRSGEEITIHLSGAGINPTSFIVTDMAGRTVMRQRVESRVSGADRGNYSISTKTITAGTYLVETQGVTPRRSRLIKVVR